MKTTFQRNETFLKQNVQLNRWNFLSWHDFLCLYMNESFMFWWELLSEIICSSSQIILMILENL